MSLSSTKLPGVPYTSLKWTEEEAKQIKKLLPDAQVLTGAAATEAALKKVPGPSILHIATHGFFNRNRPSASANSEVAQTPVVEIFKPSISLLFYEFPPAKHDAEHIYSLSQSGIVLAGANNPEKPGGEDGIVTSFEVSGLNLRGTKLVVLSACETGIGQVESGNGVYGLRRAVELAGAESQVMSLWRVNDEITRDIMIAFYTRLRAGEARGEALRQVKLSMLKNKNYSHPYFWASFIQSGDCRSIAAKLN